MKKDHLSIMVKTEEFDVLLIPATNSLKYKLFGGAGGKNKPVLLYKSISVTTYSTN